MGSLFVVIWRIAQATKPGGALLFHRLSDSTIGAVWFHGRVRDGIGWVTDAMATKLCGLRKFQKVRNRCADHRAVLLPCIDVRRSVLSLMVGLIKRE